MPTRLSPRELQEIAGSVSTLIGAQVIRDLDFETTDKISEEDYVAIVQNGVNKKVGVKLLYDTFHIGKYTVNLYVVRGSAIIRGSGSADIVAEVLRDQDVITDKIAANYFSWERSSISGTGDTEWNLSHRGVGNTIHVTSADVNRACSFTCSVPIEVLNNLNL